MSLHNGFEFLAPHTGSAYRQLFVSGTHIRAATVFRAANRIDNGESPTPAQVAEDFGIPIGAVYEAIRYCEANPVEIAIDRRAEELMLEAQGLTRSECNGRVPLHAMNAQTRERIRQQLESEFSTAIPVK